MFITPFFCVIASNISLFLLGSFKNASYCSFVLTSSGIRSFTDLIKLGLETEALIPVAPSLLDAVDFIIALLNLPVLTLVWYSFKKSKTSLAVSNFIFLKPKALNKGLNNSPILSNIVSLKVISLSCIASDKRGIYSSGVSARY